MTDADLGLAWVRWLSGFGFLSTAEDTATASHLTAMVIRCELYSPSHYYILTSHLTRVECRFWFVIYSVLIN
jgi:hypothetical protein